MPALGTALRQELERLLEPLVSAAGSAERWPLVLALIGREADAAQDPGLQAALDDLAALAALEDVSVQTWEGIEELLTASSQAMGALRELEQAASDPARVQNLGADLAQQLTAVQLRRYHPLLFRLAALVTLVEPDAVRPAGAQVRTTWIGDDLHLDRIGPLLRDPWAQLSAAYLPNGLATAADAHAAADRLFPLLSAAASALGLAVATEQRSLAAAGPDVAAGESDHFERPEPAPEDAPAPSPPTDLGPYYRANQPRLTFQIPQLKPDGTLAGTFLGVEIAASSLEHPGGVAGLIVALTGALNWAQMNGPWSLTATSEGTLPAFVIGPGGLKLASGATGPAASARLFAARQSATPGAPAFILGPATGTRIELGSLTAAIDLALSAAARNAGVAVNATSGRLVIAPGDGDGFLQAALPASGVSVSFDVGLALSSARGFEVTGGVGLQTTLPAHVSLGSLGSVDGVRLGLVAGESLSAEVGAAVTVHLGPVDVSIDGIGVRAVTTFGEGNLGVADLDIGFKGPTQLALSVDAGPVVGGGFLAFDPAKGEYAGELHLEFEGIAVRALGLLTTRLPGGRPGYSLLVVVSASSRRCSSGSGSAWSASAGCSASTGRSPSKRCARAQDRRARGRALAARIRSERRAARVATLARFVPACRGPSHLRSHGADHLGLAGADHDRSASCDRTALASAAGRPRTPAGACLPDQRAPVVRLQMDMLGVIDFGKRRGVRRRDAGRLAPGRIRAHRRHGAADELGRAADVSACRRRVPPALRRAARLPGARTGGGRARRRDNPKLRLEAYLALTSNTVQFGARIDLAAKAGKFTVAGFLVVRRAGHPVAAFVHRRHRRQACGEGRRPHAFSRSSLALS